VAAGDAARTIFFCSYTIIDLRIDLRVDLRVD